MIKIIAAAFEFVADPRRRILNIFPKRASIIFRPAAEGAQGAGSVGGASGEIYSCKYKYSNAKNTPRRGKRIVIVAALIFGRHSIVSSLLKPVRAILSANDRSRTRSIPQFLGAGDAPVDEADHSRAAARQFGVVGY